MIGLWIVYGAIMSGLLAAAAIVAPMFWTTLLPLRVPVLVVATVLLVLTGVIEPQWRFRVHRWETTEHAVYARSGWLVRQWRVAPLSRIQTVDASQGPLERIFGLSTLTVTTASSGGAITVVGLDHELASRVADELTQIVQITPGDAT